MRVLVISVHPDDEALGCGGTILRHRGRDDELYWAIVTECRPPRWSTKTIELKEAEVARAAELYGMKKTFRFGFPTMQLDQVPQADLIQEIHRVVSELQPAIVYTVHGGDVHTDHRAAFSALTSAIKPFNMRRLGVRRVLSFETLSSTDASPQLAGRLFLPNVFHDITPYIEDKIRCVKLFETEDQNELQPRGESAIRALARYRGATIDVEYAEAFMLIRECG